MNSLLSTGQCARLLNISEPTLSEAVRRGRLQSRIPVVAGRRLWDRDAVLEAARLFGCSPAKIEATLGRNADSADGESERADAGEGGDS
jgi:hypothetical protein